MNFFFCLIATAKSYISTPSTCTYVMKWVRYKMSARSCSNTIPSGSTGMFHCAYILPSPTLTRSHQPGGSDTMVSHPLGEYCILVSFDAFWCFPSHWHVFSCFRVVSHAVDVHASDKCIHMGMRARERSQKWGHRSHTFQMPHWRWTWWPDGGVQLLWTGSGAGGQGCSCVRWRRCARSGGWQKSRRWTRVRRIVTLISCRLNSFTMIISIWASSCGVLSLHLLIQKKSTTATSVVLDLPMLARACMIELSSWKGWHK